MKQGRGFFSFLFFFLSLALLAAAPALAQGVYHRLTESDPSRQQVIETDILKEAVFDEVEYDGVSVQTAEVSLRSGGAFLIEMDAASTGGGSITVDLYNGDEGYDDSSRELVFPIQAGENHLSGKISYEGNHPDTCLIRIFSYETVQVEILSLRVDRLSASQLSTSRMTAILPVLLVTAVFAVLAVLLAWGMGRLAGKRKGSCPDAETDASGAECCRREPDTSGAECRRRDSAAPEQER